MTIQLTRTTVRLGMQLAAGITVTEDGPDALRVGSDTGWITVKKPSAGARALLAALAEEPAAEADLAALITELDGESGLLGMHMQLARLGGGGLLQHTVSVDGSILATLRAIGTGGIRLAPKLDQVAPVKLSRFAATYAERGRLVVRAPRSALALELAPDAAALIGHLSDWTTPAVLAELPGPVPADAVDPLLRLFGTAGLLAPGGPDDDVETTAGQLGQWAPTDLWLHAQSRGPRTVSGYGGTYHGKGLRRPEPAVPAAFTGRRIALPTPDLAAISAADPSLTEALERRRSARVQDNDSPITVQQLAELLYRTVRLRRSFPGGDGEEVADRPYPSGGAVHELEIYPLITNCAGVEPGLWHYRTDEHCLELVAEPDKLTTDLVNRARASAVMESDPQVVLLVTARFGRVMYKYETIAYSLILKHVGVLYQTLYLVATAMGLAICGLGGGDADRLASAAKLDYFAEGSVGELVVGSRPAHDGQGVGFDDGWKGEEQSP